MKYRHELKIILIAAIFLISISGCSFFNKGEQTNSTENKLNQGKNISEEAADLKGNVLSISGNEITIAKMSVKGSGSNISGQLQDAIDEFQKKYHKIKIEKVIFDSGTDEGIEKYEKTLLGDTLAGKGPDVLYLGSSDAIKLEKSGMLEDLKPFIEKDKSFNKKDYNMNIINAGMYNGKLNLMPLDYYVNQYMTTKELLNSNNIDLKESYSEKDFMKSLEAYISSVNSNKNKKLFKAVGVNDGEGTMGVEGFEALKSGTALLSNDRILSLKDFLSTESLVQGITKETDFINNMPMYEGGNKVVGIINHSMAINKNTKNKSAAYNFIKCSLSTAAQTKSSKNTALIPVNNIAVKAIEDEYNSQIGKSYEYDKNDIVVQKPLSGDFQNYINKITYNVEKGTITDDSANRLMMECLTPYFQDKISYKSAVKTLQNKVKIYINE